MVIKKHNLHYLVKIKSQRKASLFNDEIRAFVLIYVRFMIFKKNITGS